METFKARLFGKELPVSGLETDVSVSHSGLQVPALQMHVLPDRVTLSVGGFDHHAMFLEWADADGNLFSMQPCSLEDTAILLENAPAEIASQFNTWHRRRLRLKIVWGSIGSFAAMIALVTVLVGVYYDETVMWVASHVTVENEERLGKSVLEQIEADGDVISEGPAVDTLAALGKRLTDTSAYHYQWLILDKKSVNAFALPGGIVVVHAGMINKVKHADELAAVLAHEIQHVEQRHALQSAISSLGWATALMLVLGDVNVATAAIAHQLGNLYFSRDKESEADSNGYRLLASKNIKPGGMLTLLQTLKKQPRSDMPEWLSSHPDIDARIAAIEQMIKNKPCPTCQPVELKLAQLRLDMKKVKNRD